MKILWSPPFASSLHCTAVPRESRDCITWQRPVFIPVVPGRPPNPKWPHHFSHSRLGNGLRTWRYVWGTTLKNQGCLRIKAQRNSPVSKTELSSILSVAATPNRGMYCWQCLVAAAGSLWFMSVVLEHKLHFESAWGVILNISCDFVSARFTLCHLLTRSA